VDRNGNGNSIYPHAVLTTAVSGPGTAMNCQGRSSQRCYFAVEFPPLASRESDGYLLSAIVAGAGAFRMATNLFGEQHL